MAKVKPKPRESKTVTLSTGTKVTGPVEVIDKVAKRDRQEQDKAPDRSTSSK